MSKKAEVTAKNFHTILTSQVAAFGRFRDRMQDLLDFALVQASNGNYTYINAVINAKLTGVDRRAVQKYIEDHCDVQLVSEDKAFKFKSKKTKGFKYVAPEKSWFEYAPTAEPKPVMPVESIMSQIKRLHSAIKGEGKAFVEKGHVKEAKAVLAHLVKTPGLDSTKVQAILKA